MPVQEAKAVVDSTTKDNNVYPSPDYVLPKVPNPYLQISSKLSDFPVHDLVSVNDPRQRQIFTTAKALGFSLELIQAWEGGRCFEVKKEFVNPESEEKARPICRISIHHFEDPSYLKVRNNEFANVLEREMKFPALILNNKEGTGVSNAISFNESPRVWQEFNDVRKHLEISVVKKEFGNGICHSDFEFSSTRDGRLLGKPLHLTTFGSSTLKERDLIFSARLKSLLGSQKGADNLLEISGPRPDLSYLFCREVSPKSFELLKKAQEFGIDFRFMGTEGNQVCFQAIKDRVSTLISLDKLEFETLPKRDKILSSLILGSIKKLTPEADLESYYKKEAIVKNLIVNHVNTSESFRTDVAYSLSLQPFDTLAELLNSGVRIHVKHTQNQGEPKASARGHDGMSMDFVEGAFYPASKKIVLAECIETRGTQKLIPANFPASNLFHECAHALDYIEHEKLSKQSGRPIDSNEWSFGFSNSSPFVTAYNRDRSQISQTSINQNENLKYYLQTDHLGNSHVGRQELLAELFQVKSNPVDPKYAAILYEHFPESSKVVELIAKGLK